MEKSKNKNFNPFLQHLHISSLHLYTQFVALIGSSLYFCLSLSFTEGKNMSVWNTIDLQWESGSCCRGGFRCFYEHFDTFFHHENFKYLNPLYPR